MSILTHVITWVCGRPVFVWKWLTFTEWSRLPHYTGAMLKLKAAKIAVGSGLVLCAGSGAIYVPHIIGGGGWFEFTPRGYERMVATPEPGTLAVLAVAVPALAMVRRYRRRRTK